MRIGSIGTQGVGASGMRFETGAMRRARAAVSPTPFSLPPIEPVGADADREPNTRYDPRGKVSELHVARPRNPRLLDIKV
jgi:hypothetical protein